MLKDYRRRLLRSPKGLKCLKVKLLLELTSIQRMDEQREGLDQAHAQIEEGKKMTADAVYELVKAKKVQGKKNAFVGAAGGASAGAIAGGCAGIALGPVGAVARK